MASVVLEHPVEFARRADAVLHEVQVVVGVNRRELPAQQQRVAMPDEDRLDGGEFFCGFHGTGEKEYSDETHATRKHTADDICSAGATHLSLQSLLVPI
jgi:hypothetical protein